LKVSDPERTLEASSSFRILIDPGVAMLMMRRVCVSLALAVPPLLTGGVAGSDEIDFRIKAITAFSEGKTNDPVGLSGLSTLSPEIRADLLKRTQSSPPQIRALILFNLIVNKQGDDLAPELDALLKRGFAAGKLRVESEGDLLRIAASFPDVQKEPLRGLAAGMYLAKNNIREDTSSLAKYTQILNIQEGEQNTGVARQEATVYIGLLHLRRIISDASQRALEKALQDPNWIVRGNAAKFVSVTAHPRSVEALVNSLRKEDQALNFQIKLWALSKATPYPVEALWPQVPTLLAMMEDFEITDEARQNAFQAARIITGKEDRKSIDEWLKEKKGMIEEMKATAAKKGFAAPATDPKTSPDKPVGTASPNNPPVTPDNNRPPTPSATVNPDKELTNWLLLAKNFMNQKNYEKAEEFLKRVLEKAPDSKQGVEAKELLKQVEAVKGL
jgi:tetratricopeptide (TPR) repeat protein